MDSHLKKLLEQPVSFSRLTLFENCPYRWFLKYVKKKEESDSLPLLLGKAVHKAIEEKMLGKTDKEALLEGWSEVDYYPLDLVEYETLFRRSNVVRGEAHSLNVEVEKHFTLPLDPKYTIRVQGYIDVFKQIFGTYSFTDWKTNRFMYDPMDNRQLALYAWAISQMYNVTEVSGTLFFLRYFKDNAKTVLFKQREMEIARQWAFNLAMDIHATLINFFEQKKSLAACFPATSNPGCSNCPFSVQCISTYPHISKGEGVFVR
ncbi:PD-(D/E)XK nuclease family protein [Bacillus sp. 1P06AnD]|uniref:PD-(D/E)XK nuclease family protein n=1 Tax=Bacillus sp. 1P06AnD TaxID=3132208 RepID=UPI00399F889D